MVLRSREKGFMTIKGVAQLLIQELMVAFDKKYTGSIILEMHLNQGNILRSFIINRQEVKVKEKD